MTEIGKGSTQTHSLANAPAHIYRQLFLPKSLPKYEIGERGGQDLDSFD